MGVKKYDVIDVIHSFQRWYLWRHQICLGMETQTGDPIAH